MSWKVGLETPQGDNKFIRFQSMEGENISQILLSRGVQWLINYSTNLSILTDFIHYKFLVFSNAINSSAQINQFSQLWLFICISSEAIFARGICVERCELSNPHIAPKHDKHKATSREIWFCIRFVQWVLLVGCFQRNQETKFLKIFLRWIALKNCHFSWLSQAIMLIWNWKDWH